MNLPYFIPNIRITKTLSDSGLKSCHRPKKHRNILRVMLSPQWLPRTFHFAAMLPFKSPRADEVDHPNVYNQRNAMFWPFTSSCLSIISQRRTAALLDTMPSASQTRSIYSLNMHIRGFAGQQQHRSNGHSQVEEATLDDDSISSASLHSSRGWVDHDSPTISLVEERARQHH